MALSVHIKKKLKDFELAVDFDMDEGIVGFLGSSGCGKSMTLKCIAGIETPDEGRIVLDDEVLFDKKSGINLSPQKRKVGYLFQNYALYPNMTVYGNIAYSLKIRKVPKKTIDQKVREVARILEIESLLDRKPAALSGGQKQRVAIGAAIIRQPKAFLMDEPLSNLDAKLRAQMRVELQKLHKQLDTTIIYVTHDQTEAMTLGTKIVVMKDGLIQQVDTPQNIYDHPVNKFVAGFIGSPQMNFYDVKVDGKKLIFADGNIVELPEAIAKRIAGYSEVIMGIRGEDIKFDTTNLDVYGSHQKAVIDNTEIMGNENNLYFDFGGSVTIARVSKYEVSQVGDEVEFTFMPHKMHFFDKETEQVIGAE